MLKIDRQELTKQNLLSHFTMENIHEAVFWVDSDQNIFLVNEAACRMSGYSREELIRKKVTDLNSSALFPDWTVFWERLRSEKKIVFDSQHLHKEGYYYDIEITGNYIEAEAKNIRAQL